MSLKPPTLDHTLKGHPLSLSHFLTNFGSRHEPITHSKKHLSLMPNPQRWLCQNARHKMSDKLESVGRVRLFKVSDKLKFVGHFGSKLKNRRRSPRRWRQVEF